MENNHTLNDISNIISKTTLLIKDTNNITTENLLEDNKEVVDIIKNYINIDNQNIDKLIALIICVQYISNLRQDNIKLSDNIIETKNNIINLLEKNLKNNKQNFRNFVVIMMLISIFFGIVFYLINI